MRRFIYTLSILSIVWISYSSISIYMTLDRLPNKIGRWMITDRHGYPIADLPGKWGYRIPYTGDLSSRLIEDIITTEDRRYLSHHGVDILGKLSALKDTLWYDTLRGGSTITEQYVKNRYFSDKKRSLLQKLREAHWAMIVEWRYSKDEILRRYLDSVYMGNNLYGIETVMQEYFPGESIDTLSDKSILEVITRLRYPNLGGNSETYRKNLANALSLSGAEQTLPERQKKTYQNLFPLFTERLKKELNTYCSGLPSRLGEFMLDDIPYDICENTGDTVLKTSLDRYLTIRSEEILESTIAPLEDKNVKNGAIYGIDTQSKKVIIYLGNRNDSTGNAIDMIQVRRSVGSTLKPFLYRMVLKSGNNPDDLILDTREVYKTGEAGVSYMTENYNPKSYGPITLRDALGNSLNSATTRLSEYIGIGRIYNTLRSLGFALEHDAGYYGYSIMLGGIELSLEELITGYHSLTDMTDRENFLLAHTLMDESYRSMTFGVSSILNTSIPLAVKTGTSTDFRDNWTIGYNNDIILGIWVGNVDNSSMDDVSGVTGAGPIYHSIVEDLIAKNYIKNTPPLLPTGIVESEICLDEKCFQKELTYTKEGYTRRSRPKSNIYYEGDFVTPLTREEKEEWNIR